MATDRRPWCTICGSPGQVTAESIDLVRPIGKCLAGHTSGTAHLPGTMLKGKFCCTCGVPWSKGCGRVVLTRSEPEALAVSVAYNRRVATRQHIAHLRRRVKSPLCDRCADTSIQSTVT